MNSKQPILIGMSALAALSANAQQRPNIIYIMCDDMGYGDLGCYGQQYISTPNIDRLATQGIRFTQAYCGSPVSAPSRASFMTGQHTGHTKVRGNKEHWSGSVAYGAVTDYAVVGQEPYDTDHKIIPEIFKDNGYTTGMFGKWAGGYEGSPSVPETRGIDTFYGYNCQFQAHSYFPNFLNRYDPKHHGDTKTVRVILEDNIRYQMSQGNYAQRTQYSADLIHDYAMRWLDEQTADQPFLGIFTYTIPHAELWQPNDSILQAYDGFFCDDTPFSGQPGSRYVAVENPRAQFAAMITRLDMQVGQIMAKLEEKGLADNTVLIFTSDNGPHAEGGAQPQFFNRDGLLQGIKRSMHEGGIRIPFIVRWPARIKPGQVSDQTFAFYDLMPTFCDIAGIENYQERYRNPKLGDKDYFDGISIYPTLTGEGTQQQHSHLYWEFKEGSDADWIGVRMGDWKLIVYRGDVRLYDLATDIHEDNNIAAQHPDIVSQMLDFIKQDHIDSPMFPVTLPKY